MAPNCLEAFTGEISWGRIFAPVRLPSIGFFFLLLYINKVPFFNVYIFKFLVRTFVGITYDHYLAIFWDSQSIAIALYKYIILFSIYMYLYNPYLLLHVSFSAISIYLAIFWNTWQAWHGWFAQSNARVLPQGLRRAWRGGFREGSQLSREPHILNCRIIHTRSVSSGTPVLSSSSFHAVLQMSLHSTKP